jgi:hypothetical protein
MPSFVSETLKDGIKFFDNRLHGFANPDSILTGMETRSSSPVRILRDENLVSNIRGIYPCGEGQVTLEVLCLRLLMVLSVQLPQLNNLRHPLC